MGLPVTRRIPSRPFIKPQASDLKRVRIAIVASCLLSLGFLALSFDTLEHGVTNALTKVVANRDDSLTSSSAADVVGCNDKVAGCEASAAAGECASSAGFMLENCLDSCGGCIHRFVHDVPREIQLSGTGNTMPAIGLGTAGLGQDTATVVEQALRLGYRRLDSAQAREWYREDLVGQGFAASDVPREQVFITTKVHPRNFGATSTEKAIQRSLSDLGTSYVDMALLHYAECWGDICDEGTPEGTWKDAWRELEALADAGLVKCIGVSNFGVDQLVELLQFARLKPCLVQRNSEPLRPDYAAQAFCRLHGIQYESYSTLGGQYYAEKSNPVLENETVQMIARTRRRTPAQVVLRWALQQRMTVVPRSANRDHLIENLSPVFDFDLSDEELSALAALALGD